MTTYLVFHSFIHNISSSTGSRSPHFKRSTAEIKGINVQACYSHQYKRVIVIVYWSEYPDEVIVIEV